MDNIKDESSGFLFLTDVLHKAVCSQLRQILILPSKPLTWFHFNKCSNDQIFDQKSKITEKVQKLKTDLCIRTLIFLLSSPINLLTTRQIYLLTLWKGLTRRL